MSKTKTTDFTEGIIYKQLLLYFLPLATGNIFQRLYNAADSIIVGRYLGTSALAAVGGSPQLVIVVLCNFFIAFFNGGSVYVAQLFGAHENEKLEKTVHSLFIFSFACGVFLSITGYNLTENILKWMGTPQDCMLESIIYLKICFIGTFFQLVYNMCAGVLRAVGDSKSPFMFLVFTCILNVFLDLFLIAKMGLDVEGAALATVISQGICCTLAFIKMCNTKDAPYAIKWSKLRMNWQLLKNMLLIGLPMGMQSLAYNVTNVYIQVGINTLGKEMGSFMVAAFGVSKKIEGFFWGVMNAANTTVTNFVGQNYGKGDNSRIKKGIKTSLFIFVGFTVLFGAVIYFGASYIIPVFTNDVDVVDVAISILRFYGPLYWIWSINEVYLGATRGQGKTFATMVISLTGVCVIRLSWVAIVFGKYKTLHSLLLSYPISWILATIGVLIYYYFIKSKDDIKAKL